MCVVGPEIKVDDSLSRDAFRIGGNGHVIRGWDCVQELFCVGTGDLRLEKRIFYISRRSVLTL